MPVVMHMQWNDVTPHQYDELRHCVDLEQPVPPRPGLHLAWFTDTGLNIVELWTAAEDFQAYLDHRFMPAAVKAGLPDEPTITVSPAHSVVGSTDETGG